MNNLKRVLSLVLALVMIVGVMAVASATEFTDQKEITHTEAVDTMNALGVILGKDDGSYDPTANITRGEMCTIIARILNSGKLPAVGSSSAYHFTDIETHWARNYIEYCANLGIVAGRGDGTFDPNASVTGAEAAKMLMVAAGYQADFYGFVGKDWELNTNSIANQKGLYAQLGNLDTSAVLNRDNAAQMAFNALSLQTMVVNYSKDRTTGAVTEIYDPETDTLGNKVTVLAKYFGATTKYGYISNIAYNADKKVYTYTFSRNLFGAADTDAPIAINTTLSSDKDYSDLYGRKVAVIYKGAGTSAVLFGVSGVGEVLFEGAWADVSVSDDEKTLTFAKTAYTFDDDATGLYSAFDSAVTQVSKTAAEANGLMGYFAFQAIDNDDDGKVDVVVYKPVTVGQVAYVGAKNFYLDGQPTVTTANVTVYDGMAKGDWVAVTADLNGKAVYTKIDAADIINGTVTASNGTTAQIDGTYYDLKVSGDAAYDTAAKVKTLVTDKAELNLILVNGKVAAVDLVTAETVATTFGVVIKTATGVSALDETKQVRVLQADGTTADLTVGTATDFTYVTPGKLVTIAGPSSNVYTLKSVDDEAPAIAVYTTNGNNTYDADNGKLGAYTIADDAVVFVKSADATPKYSVITGAALKKYAAGSFNATNSFVKTNSTTKFDQVAVAYVTLTNAATLSSKVYGYVTSTVTNTAKSQVVDIYATSGNLEAAAVTSVDGGSISAYTVTRDTVVVVSDNGDGTYSTVKQTAIPVAITKWDASTGAIEFTKENKSTVTSTVKSTTKVLYVDTANRVGADGKIQLAGSRNIAAAGITADVRTVMNALVVLDDSGNILVLVVDTANSLSSAAATANGATNYFLDA